MDKLPIDQLFFLIDFLGVFVGALGGALAAVRDTRYKYDLVGVTGLALAGAVAGMIFASRIGKSTERAIIMIDAAALGLFAVSGSTRAINAGLRRLPALLLGGVTAVGGGSLRDVLSGRTPKIFERGELYAIAAVFGAAMFLFCDWIGLSRELSTLAGTLGGFGLRLLALRFHWETRPLRSES
jgi:uncharacterized membrane protein YeiH